MTQKFLKYYSITGLPKVQYVLTWQRQQQQPSVFPQMGFGEGEMYASLPLRWADRKVISDRPLSREKMKELLISSNNSTRYLEN